jgi:hypothetical protein
LAIWQFGNDVLLFKMAVSVENSRVELKVPVEILLGTYEEFVLGFKLAENSEGVNFKFYILNFTK